MAPASQLDIKRVKDTTPHDTRGTVRGYTVIKGGSTRGRFQQAVTGHFGVQAHGGRSTGSWDASARGQRP